jgi:hypothetical protein
VNVTGIPIDVTAVSSALNRINNFVEVMRQLVEICQISLDVTE